jgi:hypothetical protein
LKKGEEHPYFGNVPHQHDTQSNGLSWPPYLGDFLLNVGPLELHRLGVQFLLVVPPQVRDLSLVPPRNKVSIYIRTFCKLKCEADRHFKK